MFKWTSIRMYSLVLHAVLNLPPLELKLFLTEYRDNGYTHPRYACLAVFEDGRWISIEDGKFDSNDIDWTGWVD